MTFLALIIALLLVFIWGSGAPLQEDKWFKRWRAQLDHWDLPEVFVLVLSVLAPALLVQVLLASIESVAFGLIWIAFSAIVLVYSLGRGDFEEAQYTYRSRCRSGDFEAAYLAAEFDLREATPVPCSPQEVHQLAQTELLYEGYQRFFAVLFFFLLLGPAGALAYRLLQFCLARDNALAQSCMHVVDWIPARLLAATFALTGDFVRSRETLMEEMGADSGALLFAVGEASLSPIPAAEDYGEWAAQQNEALSALLKRSAGAWLILISLLVVFL